jgi:hypothetical protein
MIWRLQNYGATIFAVCFTFKGRHLQASIKYVNGIYYVILILTWSFVKRKEQHFYSYLPTEKFPVLRYLGLRMVVILGSTYACKQLFPHEWDKKKSHLTYSSISFVGWDSDSLQAGQSRIGSWWGKNFLHPSRPALGPTQPPI